MTTRRELVLLFVILVGTAVLVWPSSHPAPRTWGRDRAPDLVAVQRAVDRVSAEMETEPDSSLRRATRDFLDRLVVADKEGATPEVRPAVARLIVRDGWLDEIAGGVSPSALGELRSALEVATTFEITDSWSKGARRRRTVKDAWGHTATLHVHPEGTTLVLPPVTPMMAPWRLKALSKCQLVLRFEAGTDPIGDADAMARLERAAFSTWAGPLAWWSKADGFGAEVEAWRAAFPLSKGVAVTNRFPPHVPIVGLGESLYGVAVPEGLLRPAQDPSQEEAERFLEDAARLLPDAAHLDLLQQYYMMYSFDSPDPARPLAIGSQAARSDLHQTAHQTLATVAGGVCRGDCDDFAELASDVARRQGKLAHVLSVPAHLAATWAEEQEDGWHVFILQTGPAMEFVKDTLPKAVRRAYAGFDGTEPIDTDALNVSLRFNGESIRMRYRLSWRIFVDREYADAMIGIQKDWHESTLLQGIRKVVDLLAGDDRDAANYSELAALYAGTGQFEKAAQLHHTAGERAPDEERRMHRLLDELGTLVAGKMKDEAIALATEMVEVRLPRVAPRWGFRALTVEKDLASWITGVDGTELAAQWLVRAARRPWAKKQRSLVELLEPGVEKKAWGSWWTRKMLRRVLRGHASASVYTLRRMDPDVRAADKNARTLHAFVETWIKRAAFVELEEPRRCLDRWALVGSWLELESPSDFLDRLERVAPPATADEVDHAALAQDPESERALAWVRASPYSFANRLWFLVEDRDHRPDPALVRRLATLLEQAVDASRRLGYEIVDTDRTVHAARVHAALLAEDLEALRALFRNVKRMGSSRIAGRTASAMGRVAPHLDLAFWKQAVDCWVEEIGYRPLYFQIAWSAVCADAAEHGLHVADLTAKQFASNKVFVQEAAFMRRLLEGRSED